MILYFSRNPNYSSNAIYIKGLKKIGADIESFSGSFFGCLKFIYGNWNKVEKIIVEPDRPDIVIGLKLLTLKKVIYNALCSVYERLIVSRSLAGRFSVKAFYYWLLDFIAVHLSHKVMLETNEQTEYFRKLFGAARKKYILAYTGVDQEKYFFSPSIKKFEKFTVIFRGRLLPEAGGEVVVKAAKLLENEDLDILMIAAGMKLSKVEELINKLKPKNLRLLPDQLPLEKLREIMQASHLSLGQLADHPRLERTVPHKCFESLAMKIPYLTAKNKAVMGLLKEGETCLACNPGDAKDLAEKIIWAKNHKTELQQIAENGYRFFKSNLTEEKLASLLLTQF